MKTVAFVPIKLNNQRTPGKNIKKFDDGSSLITVFLRNLIKVKSFDDVYVFCSNPKIKEYIVPGVKYLERPVYLDTQEATHKILWENLLKELMQIFMLYVIVRHLLFL